MINIQTTLDHQYQVTRGTLNPQNQNNQGGSKIFKTNIIKLNNIIFRTKTIKMEMATRIQDADVTSGNQQNW